MNTKIIDAKCPYCKTEFTTSAFGSDWARTLWGEYSSTTTKHTCPKCGKESVVSLTCTYRYSAKKIKEATP
jgi:endogenous inhibitor of DNA gyrase (YacG/DUF329 family)